MGSEMCIRDRFDPFPPAMRERYPVFRLSYEWQFMSGRSGAEAVRTGAP